MRQLFFAALFICFIFFISIQAQTVNPANLLKQLLDLPAPPPLDELSSQALKSKPVSREPGFYDKNRIPPDDAPIEELLDYWSMQSRTYRLLRYNVKPSDKTIERLLEYCEDKPEGLNLFLNILPTRPKIAESVKHIYDLMLQVKTREYGIYTIRNWLVYHSDVYVDELLKKAEKVKDKDEYVTNQAELLALTRIDWEKAAPILEKLVNDKNQPVSSTLAKWAYYTHALATGDDGDISKYRRQLQEVVENRNSRPGARDLALDSLVSETDWDGRDDWYLSLLSDETLYELKINNSVYTGLTTLLLYSPPEKYIKAMAALVESKNSTVRKAAIKNLTTQLGEANIDAVRALLPWLANPNWAGAIVNGRAALINAVGKVDLPESIPGLIAILTNEEEFRPIAAQALAGYKDARAVPALKLALATEKNPYNRNIFINALIECGGLTDDEQMSALETYATAISTTDGLNQYDLGGYYRRDDVDNEKPPKTVPLAISIGSFVAFRPEQSDGLVVRAIERLKALRKTKPAVAGALAGIMRRWKGRVIFIERLRQIRDGEADLETILAALAKRKEIREKVPNDVFALRGAAGTGRGIGACLAEDNTDFLNILGQKDADAQTAMLGCARLLRAILPVPEVGSFLKNVNKNLALAAERYLESEDSLEARLLVLGQHQNEAVILGARQAFIPDFKNVNYTEKLNEVFQSVTGRAFLVGNFSNLDKTEETLRREIKTNPDLLAVYGILPNKADGQQVIRVFKDKITFTDYEDAARYREKTLTAKEYEDFFRFLIDEKVDTTTPSVGSCYDCESSEFIMFGRDGGRRVFFSNTSIERAPIKNIFARFASFNQGELKLHYLLADKIKGLEVLLADDKFEARAVWKNGNDLRVLVEDSNKEEEIEKNLSEQFQVENSVEIDEENYEELEKRRDSQNKRREEAEYAHYFWRGFENGKLGGVLPQPLEIPFLIDETQFPETTEINPNPRAWQVRAGNYEIRTSYSEEGGLFKVRRSQTSIKIKDGNYSSPIVTADENWVIVAKPAAKWGEPGNLFRINLPTGKEFQVNLPPADILKPVAFIASPNKVLIIRAKAKRYNYDGEYQVEQDEEETPVQPDKNDKNPSPPTPEYYLLDAATGATQLVKGEFRPIQQQTFRPLQMTAAPNEFWAAIYDKKLKETAIGRYNTKTFSFLPVTKLPEIKLDSMDIWVDEKAAKIYFVYQGHLLAAPLQNQQK
ncbi:MAG: HEAT repeat domain-containing protein [Actinomycetota bacterium]